MARDSRFVDAPHEHAEGDTFCPFPRCERGVAGMYLVKQDAAPGKQTLYQRRAAIRVIEPGVKAEVSYSWEEKP